MDFSAPEQLELHPQDLNALLEKSLLLVGNELLIRRISVIRQLGPGLPLVQLDGPKMEQAFVNVLTNAAQAMPDGGALTVRTYAIAGQPCAASKAGGKTANTASTRVMVEIDDTGPGVPEEKLGRVFEPFFTTKAPGQGTGLGLSVCRRIILLHSGSIEMKNLPAGGGARVTVTLNA
jgi:signal transduction histidine kinase